MGVKSKKKAKTRLDAYYRLAKEQGYRARSAFKLLQLNRKYDFLAKARVLVDLCAAPGGWCQVAAKYMPVGSKIVGVDLVPIQPIRGVKTFVGDITDDKTRKMIVTWLKKEPVDCVIHDGAPNVGGVWSRDLYDQNALVLASAKMACSMLRPGGWFVTKVFRSVDFHKLLWVFKQLFEKVEGTKPLASRMESAEIFVVCAGYQAPKKLDPEMFNPQKVFREVEEEKIVSASGALVTPKSNVPQGYDEFATISHRVSSFTDFIEASDPKAFLKMQHELRFTTEEDKRWLKSKSSRKELVFLCSDLQQVGEADRRRLLRWREQLLREKAQQDKLQGVKADGESDGDEDDLESMDGGGRSSGSDSEMHIDLENPESVTQIARELLEIRKKKAKEIKKRQKKVVDRKLKQIKGLINYDPNAVHEEVHTDGGRGALMDDENEEDTEAIGGERGELDDFTVEKLKIVDETDMASIMDKAVCRGAEGKDYDGGALEQEPVPLNPIVAVNLAAQEDWAMGDEDEDESDEDGMTAAKKREADGIRSLPLVEGEEFFMDVDNYGNYVPAERSARVKLYEGGLEPLTDEDEEGDGEETIPESKEERKKAKDSNKLDEAGKQSKWQRHHLNITQVLSETFPTGQSDKKKMKKGKGSAAGEETKVLLSTDQVLRLPDDDRKKRKRTRFEDLDSDDTDNEDDEDESGIDDEEVEAQLRSYEVNQGRKDSRRKREIVSSTADLTTQELVRSQRKQVLLDNKKVRNAKKKQQNEQKKESSDDNTFEEIPVALTDPTIRARTLAIAQKMLDPKARREILDASVNKYMFNDDDDLPDWFVKDEQRNCRIELPVTAEEIEEQRNRFRELNARPSKKVMEALGRKRRRAQRLLHNIMEKGKSDPRAREKANQLSVRKLMRAQVIKGQGKKKHKYLDAMAMGNMRRERQKAKRERQKGGKKKR